MIRFTCSQCKRSLKVPTSAAGKKGRCDKCGYLNTIPDSIDREEAPEGEANPKVSSEGSTYSVRSSVNGEVFGPADSTTIKQWWAEGRITELCHVQETGRKAWKPAGELFPPAAATKQAGTDSAPTGHGATALPMTSAGSGNIFRDAETASTASIESHSTGQEIVPTWGDLGFCVSHAFNTWKQHLPLLISVSATIFGISFVIQLLMGVILQAVEELVGGAAAAVIGVVASIALSSVLLWLNVGAVKIWCKLALGKPTEYQDLFASGRRVLPMVVFCLALSLLLMLGSIPFVVSLELLLGGMAPVILILSGVLFCGAGVLLTWPIGFLIIDRDMLGSAFGKGLAIGWKNFLLSIPLLLIATICSASGVLACGVGSLVTGSLGGLILATGYLNMSGQLRPR